MTGATTGIANIALSDPFVSIPTRPGGRVRRRAPDSWARTPMFQSPPDPEAGCDSGNTAHAATSAVSIPTRPGGRVRRGCGAPPGVAVPCFNPHPTRRPGATPLRPCPEPGHTPVSIPTRPGGRVRRYDVGRIWVGSSCFNPHPTRRPGATSRRRLIAAHSRAFQSPPDPEAGCDTSACSCRRQRAWFQSPPDPEAGCD